MPRNIRPSWLSLAVDHNGNAPTIVKETGPKGRAGSSSATLRVRSDGAVLPLLSIDAIGSADGGTVLVRVVDLRNGAVKFLETFQQ